MNKPFINALSATTYITFVASIIYYSPKTNIPENSVIIPIAFLSLFVLSAAMMGYFFIFQPAQLFFEGKQKEGTKFFLKTVAIFTCITIAIVATWLLLSFAL